MLSLFLWLLLLPFSTAEALEIPKDLSPGDQTEVLKTLGMNSSSKLLSNPFPLGGYSGLEIGVSMIFIDTAEVRRLGCNPDADPSCPNKNFAQREVADEFTLPQFVIGKGLYNNLDIFMHFAPSVSENELTEYGMKIRWTFYQARFLPINISILAHANSFNFEDSFTNENVGFDLISGVYVNNFSLYFGGGILRSSAEFTGGSSKSDSDSVVDPSPAAGQTSLATRTATKTLQQIHSLVGVSFHYQNYFIAAQIDRYRDPVISAKLGLRF